MGGVRRVRWIVRPLPYIARMTNYVLVAGAWLGAWAWDDVVPDLRAAGHGAHAVTLLAEFESDDELIALCLARIHEDPGGPLSFSIADLLVRFGPRVAPAALEAFVNVNPISILADASRGLMAGDVDMADIGIVFGTAVALTAIFMPLTTHLYRTRSV